MLISAGEIIKASFRLYKDNFKLFISYVAMLLLPGLLFIATLPFHQTGTIGTMVTSWIISIVLTYLFSLWISITFIRAVRDRYKNTQPQPVFAEIKRAAPLLWPTIVILFLTGLTVIGGGILFIIPGIIFALWFLFAYYEVVLDGKQGVEAMKRSRALVAGRWWAVFWWVVGPGLFFGLMYFILQGIITGLLGVIHNNFADGPLLLIYTINILLSVPGLLITPLSTSAMTILYIELDKTPVKK
jgi:hypothetical protein